MSAKQLITKRNVLIFIAAILILILIIGVILKTMSINTKFDKSLITSVPTDVKILDSAEYGGFTTLAKVDNAGNIKDEPFKIIAFTDTHLDIYAKNSKHTMEMLIRNIKKAQPDLVVFVGDNITSSFNKGRVKQLCEVMEGLGVYWAPVFGNHEGDNFFSITRQQIGDIFASYPHCLFETNRGQLNDGSKVWGIGNYVINIADSSGIKQTLYFLDGGDAASKSNIKKLGLKKGSYDHLKESQIAWYGEQVDKVTALAGKVIPSIMYVHIPLAEFDFAVKDVPKSAEGKMIANQASQNGTILEFGDALEEVCSARLANKDAYSCGMFQQIKEKGSTQAIVSGHDHANNFRIKYQGVYLIYNQTSGYSSYNVLTKGYADKLLQGYSVYSIDAEGDIAYSSVVNADEYPDKMAEILKLYK